MLTGIGPRPNAARVIAFLMLFLYLSMASRCFFKRASLALNACTCVQCLRFASNHSLLCPLIQHCTEIVVLVPPSTVLPRGYFGHTSGHHQISVSSGMVGSHCPLLTKKATPHRINPFKYQLTKKASRFATTKRRRAAV